ncbi:DUF2272 domain-containing protein [Roseomonas sp. OT10]|uniref:DUF2272 domain-containing protein n=1 Tax=Roseomonas cutis TaxID=2897332 RepID=UPI001E2CC64E|nr:DUF2272 domain-containing protein [Roseomonas sp. OT10]UFN51194.1 DUF2272 domain-containing protein [Roseomonas sp. OT10]
MRPVLLPLLLLFLLAACATAPPLPQSSESHSLDPARERVVRAALTEWEAWGRPVQIGWALTLEDGEPSPENFPRILEYWQAVNEGRGVVRQLRALHDQMTLALAEGGQDPLPQPSISLFAYPAWSAAFVSHVMRQAGLGESDFPASSAHARYIDSLLARAAVDPDWASFRPEDPLASLAQPGDLLCADRSSLPLLHWTERLAEAGRFRPMHCDVVVTVRPGLVEAVGGNVRDSVTLRRFPADEQGRVLQAPYGEPQFFLLLENRIGTRGRATPQG